MSGRESHLFTLTVRDLRSSAMTVSRLGNWMGKKGLSKRGVHKEISKKGFFCIKSEKKSPTGTSVGRGAWDATLTV